MPVLEDVAWADESDVLAFTGETVVEADLVKAQDIIELFSGVTLLATDNISQTNLRYLNRAVAYQAGWMNTRPDLFSHQDVESFSQDGASHTPASVNAQLLAPFAARWLRRLTWRTKPLRVRRRYNEFDYSNRGPRDSAVADDNRTWDPM